MILNFLHIVFQDLLRKGLFNKLLFLTAHRVDFQSQKERLLFTPIFRWCGFWFGGVFCFVFLMELSVTCV